MSETVKQPGPLQIEINALSAAFLEKVPSEVIGTINRTADELKESGISGKAIGVGEQAPNFSLPNVTGNNINLTEKLKDGPVVIIFYRGDWCPYCNLELRAYQALLPQFEAKGASLIAISPQTPDNSLTTAEKRDLRYDVLSDAGNEVARDFGLVFTLAEELRPIYAQFELDIPAHNGDDTFELPMPATYVVEQDGKISYAFVDTDYRKRAEPTDVLTAIQ